MKIDTDTDTNTHRHTDTPTHTDTHTHTIAHPDRHNELLILHIDSGNIKRPPHSPQNGSVWVPKALSATPRHAAASDRVPSAVAAPLGTGDARDAERMQSPPALTP